MTGGESTFSESWHRVAKECLFLRPGVVVKRQRFRGERWFVLENPWNNQFFRIRPEAYRFVARLHPDRTVEEVWQECLEKFPDEAPGQGGVIRLLAQLYQANLLHYHVARDSRELFERFEKRRQQQRRARLTQIMFMRIPLIDPDRILNRTAWLGRLAFSWIGTLLWLAAFGVAGKIAMDHASLLRDQTESLLAPGNLPWLYLCIIGVKLLHEFGHAYACKRFGGEVHTMGIMLLIFTPIPYMDATSSWGFRSRWKRILVGAAGMLVEVFIASLAAVVWVNTAPGVIHAIAFNVIFIASISTLLFNINPLLRFDGYYILSDLLEIPNLHQQAARQLKHLCKRYLFGLTASESPARSHRERFWITTFGILSHLYRLVVFTGIILFVADRFLLLGLIMAVICIFGWIVLPLIKLGRYLLVDPELDRHRARALAVTATLVGGVLAFLQWVPFPDHFRAPGVLQARTRSEVYTGVGGVIEEVRVRSGGRVMEGDVLLRLSNPELAEQLRRAEAARDEVNVRLRAAMERDRSVVEPLTYQLRSVEQLVQRLQEQQALLSIAAPHDGTWVAPRLIDQQGTWIPQGTVVGILIDGATFEFSATVDQDDANRLFTGELEGAAVRLFGQAAQSFPLYHLEVVPGERRQLPSPALGWLGGGEVATAAEDPQGRRAEEPFFEVRGEVGAMGAVAAYHGQSGKVRFRVGRQALLPRAVRRVRQLFQKRFQW